MKYIVNEDGIMNIIPQRPPFVMVGNIVSHNKFRTTSNFNIKTNNILVKDGVFTISGLLENIAQTAAANVGYECALTNTPIPLGFIGAISKVKVHYLPLVNSLIETSIAITNEIFNITLVEGEVKQNGRTVISCQLKILVDKAETKWNT